MSETILYDGAIHTLDADRPQATAIAIRDGRILAIGGEEIKKRYADIDNTVDLKGQCVIPGLIDAHLHFESFSLALQRIDAETATVEELLDRVRERALRQPAGTWIQGFGWNQNEWDGRFPTKEQLDRVAPDHPVYLRAKSGHAGWANSRAMQIAGVDRDSRAAPGGEILCDAAGESTGIFLEGAQRLVDHAIPEADLEEAAQAMVEGQQRAFPLGLTGVHDLDGARSLRAWQLLRERDRMQMRVCKSVPGGLLDEALAVGLRSGLGDAQLRIGGVKLFADGALGPRTAWMIEPYEGEADNRGIPVVAREVLADMIARASAGGLACFVHAIGDMANRAVLDMLEQARSSEKQRGGTRLRHRIEHAQLLHSDDLERFARLDIIASMQPLHATSDMHIVDRHWGTRGTGAYPFRTLLRQNTRLAFGSDCPVETIAPLAGIHAAVTRRRADGTPGEEGWYPDQRLSVEEALHGYTLGAAFASGEERIKGSLTPGKLADLVVLEEDLFTIPPMGILDLPVAGTMIGGQWVFAGPEFDIDI